MSYTEHEVDFIKDITEIKDTLDQHGKEIDELKASTKAMSDMNANIAVLVENLSHMRSDMSDIKATQEKTTDEISSIEDKLTVLEHRPADESYKRTLAIRDKVIIGGVSSAALAIIGALIALVV